LPGTEPKEEVEVKDNSRKKKGKKPVKEVDTEPE
jgi:hypothetical protein